MLLALTGAQLMVILDVTIANVALPTIEHDLGFSQTGLHRVVNAAYTLTFCGFLLLAGRLGDRLGRIRLYLVGLASVLEGLRRVPTPADILYPLTRAHSAALLVGALFAIAGIVVAIALIGVDKSQLEDASAAPLAA